LKWISNLSADDSFTQTINMTTIEEDAYTCGVCGHNFKANDDIVIFADKQGRACCDYCPDEAEEEEVCDDEQRSYGPRGAPAPESDDEEDVDARDAPNIYPYKKCSVCGERKSCGNYKENDWFCEGCWSGAKCDDCGGPIRDTENLDTCWTNDGEIFWCEYCREEHVEEYIRERDGEDDACDCCGEHFAELNTAEDAEGEKETYCDGCWKDKIEDGCVWKDENGEWVC
jgi:hypothetical protein